MNFKLRITLIVLFSIAISACKKEDTTGNSGGTGSGDNQPVDEVITAPPTEFETKAVVEVFGGEWCDACPAGIDVLEGLINANQDKVFGTVLHSSDPYETINYNQLFAHIGGVGSHPRAVINRAPAANSGDQNDLIAITKEHWGTNVNRFINQKTSIGLAIESSTEATKMNIKVLIRGNSFDESKNYKLTVYIIEDNISSDNQAGKPAGFLHQMVLRGSLTDAIGDDITLTDGVTLEKEYSFNLGGAFVLENLKVLAFVNSVGGTSSDRFIHNAQQVKAGKTANWD